MYLKKFYYKKKKKIQVAKSSWTLLWIFHTVRSKIWKQVEKKKKIRKKKFTGFGSFFFYYFSFVEEWMELLGPAGLLACVASSWKRSRTRPARVQGGHKQDLRAKKKKKKGRRVIVEKRRTWPAVLKLKDTRVNQLFTFFFIPLSLFLPPFLKAK